MGEWTEQSPSQREEQCVGVSVGSTLSLWRAQGGAEVESPEGKEEEHLGTESRGSWELRAGDAGREEQRLMGTKSRGCWE